MNYLYLALGIFVGAIALIYLGKLAGAAFMGRPFSDNLDALVNFAFLAVTGTASVWFFMQAVGS